MVGRAVARTVVVIPANEELVLNQQLATQGYVQQTRLIGLQRVVAEYESRLGEQRGDRGQAKNPSSRGISR